MIARRLLLGATLAAPAIARAQAVWPTRPVRIVVPFPPGGSNDVMARPLAERLQARFGQPFVVENRGGAGGSIGATAVAQAPADGHTLMVTSSSFATSAVLQKTAWDAERSFDAVAILARAPFFSDQPRLRRRATWQALVRLAKARPGEVDYGSSGAGGLNHLVSEYFCQAAGIRMTHVPYQRHRAGGDGPGRRHHPAGHHHRRQRQCGDPRGARAGHRRRRPGRRPAARGAARCATVREQGVDYEVAYLVGPAGAEEPAAAGPPRHPRRGHRRPGRARAASASTRPRAPCRPPARYDEFAAVLRADMDRWRKVAEAANIRME